MLAHNTITTAEEQFSGVYETADRRVMDPGPLARLIAVVRTGRLNAALAAGADPSACAQLAAHATMLSTVRTRGAIADQLDRLAAPTSTKLGGRWGVRPNRNAIFANAGTIQVISTLLRESTPVYAPGIAMLSELLRDGTGPLYLGDDSALRAFLVDALNLMRTGESRAPLVS